MYRKNQDGSFNVVGKSGQVWIVNTMMTKCNCPKFKFILKEMSPCHHITEVREGEAGKPVEVPEGKKVFDPEKYTTLLSLDAFCNTYGDEQYQRLLKMGEVVYFKGLVRILK